MAELTRDTTINKLGSGAGGLELDPNGTELVTINNGVMLPDGTLAEPSIRFSDDANCGILSLVNDQLNFSAHGVELVRFTGVASAVNYIELTNSITTADLSINASGTDTNISINLVPKGSGTLKVGGTNVALVGDNLSTFTNDSGFITGYTVTEGDVTTHEAALTITESQISDLGTYLTTETNDLTAAVTWANVPDANVTESSVTQHQAALSITESQISDLGTYLADVVSDTTPQLGGNLDVQANSITTSTVNGGITLTPNGTGDVTLGTMVFDADQTIGAGQDDYVLTYDNATGKISLEEAAGGGGGDSYLVHTYANSTPANVTGTNCLALGNNIDLGGIDRVIGIGSDVTLSQTTGNLEGSIWIGHDINVTNENYSNRNGSIAIGNRMNFGLGGAASGTYLILSDQSDTSNMNINGVENIIIGRREESSTSYNHGNSVLLCPSQIPYTDTSNITNNIVIETNNQIPSISDSSSLVLIGTYNSLSGTNIDYSTCLGRITSIASHCYGVGYQSSSNNTQGVGVFGYGAKGNIKNSVVFGAGPDLNSLGWGGNGRFQRVIASIGCKTTDGTAKQLSTTGNASTNHISFLVSDAAWSFHGLITASRTDGTKASEVSCFEVKGAIKNVGGTVSLVGTPTVTNLGNDSVSWSVTISADDTNNALKIEGTGEAAKDIFWYGEIEIVQLNLDYLYW